LDKPFSYDATVAVNAVVTTVEHCDGHGRLRSAVALRIMASAVSEAVPLQCGAPARLLATERVSFSQPVPIGTVLELRVTSTLIGHHRYRACVEGFALVPDRVTPVRVMQSQFLMLCSGMIDHSVNASGLSALARAA
jgi:acyl dehydratase